MVDRGAGMGITAGMVRITAEVVGITAGVAEITAGAAGITAEVAGSVRGGTSSSEWTRGTAHPSPGGGRSFTGAAAAGGTTAT